MRCPHCEPRSSMGRTPTIQEEARDNLKLAEYNYLFAAGWTLTEKGYTNPSFPGEVNFSREQAVLTEKRRDPCDRAEDPPSRFDRISETLGVL